MWHRLFTREDSAFFHAHKIIGTLCLVHFGFQLYYLCAYHTTYFPSTVFTPIVIVLHAALHLTSFQFHLSEKRNRTYNIIWPEMRWHTMIFAYRSLITLLLMHYLPPTLNAAIRGPIVIGTMWCADAVTRYYKVTGTTMRDNPYPPETPQWLINFMNLFYSASQVLGTMNVLTCTTPGRIFLILIPIQTAPFCMTLVKKGILQQRGWHVYYTLALLINYLYPSYDSFMPRETYWRLALTFMIARFQLNVNKYYLWIYIIVLQLYYLNTTLLE